jgi:thermostable 8-oxoguanine DNA glycosylase
MSNQLKVEIQDLNRKLDEVMEQFQKLKNFMKSKDRKHPSAFVVFTADKSGTKAQDAVTKVTQGLYELFLQQTNVSSSISYYLQNKVCDLYLICEHCNQTQGTSS